MNQILCSTGALIGIPNGRDYRLLEKLSGKLNCDGYEFMMYSTGMGRKRKLQISGYPIKGIDISKKGYKISCIPKH